MAPLLITAQAMQGSGVTVRVELGAGPGGSGVILDSSGAR